ncbi:MAG: hypothetical protein U0795_03835 [Pirellulales bacterium]
MAARLITSTERVRAGDVLELVVVLTVDPGYEIYSLDASAPKVPTALQLQLPAGFTALQDWESPAPVRSLNPPGHAVHTGESRFVRQIRVAEDAEPGEYLLACSVSYQACDSRQCLRPVESTLSVAVSVTR